MPLAQLPTKSPPSSLQLRPLGFFVHPRLENSRGRGQRQRQRQRQPRGAELEAQLHAEGLLTAPDLPSCEGSAGFFYKWVAMMANGKVEETGKNGVLGPHLAGLYR